MRAKSKKGDPSKVFLIGDLECGEDTISVAENCVQMLVAAHRKTPAGKPLTLFIACQGGYLNYAVAVGSTIDGIRRQGRKIVGHLLGAAESGGFFILQHCDTRVAEYGTYLMAHEVQGLPMTCTSTTLKHAKFCQKLELAQISLWSRRTGKPVEYYLSKMDEKDWNMTPDEALIEALIDLAIPAPTFP
jgi:ATP-dependent protease ClpP protease subunit